MESYFAGFFTLWDSRYRLHRVSQSKYRNEKHALINIFAVILSVLSIMTGFIAINMPDFLKGINHISILKYASEGISFLLIIDFVFHLRLEILVAAINEFTGKTFTCTSEQLATYGQCPCKFPILSFEMTQ